MWQFSKFRAQHFIFGACTEHKNEMLKKRMQGKVNFHVGGNLIRSLWDQDHPLPPYFESREPEFKLTSTYLTERCARCVGQHCYGRRPNPPNRSTYFDVLVYVFIYGQYLRHVASGSDLAQGTKYPDWDSRSFFKPLHINWQNSSSSSVTTASFHILSYSPHNHHPATRHYIVWDKHSAHKRTKINQVFTTNFYVESSIRLLQIQVRVYTDAGITLEWILN
jgi:hypothetical protein